MKFENYNIKFSLYRQGTVQDRDTLVLAYDNTIKKWIVKLQNMWEDKIKYYKYETKKEAQTFIRGRKRRMIKQRDEKNKLCKNEFNFVIESESKDY